MGEDRDGNGVATYTVGRNSFFRSDFLAIRFRRLIRGATAMLRCNELLRGVGWSRKLSCEFCIFFSIENLRSLLCSDQFDWDRYYITAGPEKNCTREDSRRDGHDSLELPKDAKINYQEYSGLSQQTVCVRLMSEGREDDWLIQIRDRMVNDPSTNELILWSEQGDSFCGSFGVPVRVETALTAHYISPFAR